MNICIYSPRFYSPSEIFILRQAQALKAVVCTKDCVHRSGTSHGVNVIELPRSGKRRTQSVWARRTQEIWRIARYRNTVLMPPAGRAAFLAALSELRPDVVLAQYGPGGLAVMGACMEVGIPLVVHFHGYDLSREYKDRWYRLSCRKLVKTARAFVVVNRVQRDRLIILGAPEEKVFLIPCGVPVDEFAPSHGVSEQPCRFIAVGRFTPKKCPGNTIRALAACASKCGNVELTMIGDGPLLSDCQRLADELGVTEHVRFMGAQTNEVVKNEMRAAGVFVQHSVIAQDGDEEGWPVAVGEAMACGLPVISTRHAGIVDQVVEGETGFLVEEGDWKAMADGMTKLAQNPHLRRSLGVAGRRRIENVGNLTDSLRRLQDVLRNTNP